MPLSHGLLAMLAQPQVWVGQITGISIEGWGTA